MYDKKKHDLVINSYPGCSGKIIPSSNSEHIIDFYSDGKVLKYFNRITDKIEIIETDNLCLYYDSSFKICISVNNFLENQNNIDLFITYMTKMHSHTILSFYLSVKESKRLFEDLGLNKKVIFEYELHYIIYEDNINELILLYKNKVFKLSGIYFIEFNKMKNKIYSGLTKEESEEYKKELLDYFLVNSEVYRKNNK